VDEEVVRAGRHRSLLLTVTVLHLWCGQTGSEIIWTVQKHQSSLVVPYRLRVRNVKTQDGHQPAQTRV
jgi:hypothetical protein